VAVVKRLQDLLEDSRSYLFAEELGLNDTVEELTARAQPRSENESGKDGFKLTL
jgi:hypothetical protein